MSVKSDIWASGIYSDSNISSGDFLPTSYLFELEFESMWWKCIALTYNAHTNSNQGNKQISIIHQLIELIDEWEQYTIFGSSGLVANVGTSNVMSSDVQNYTLYYQISMWFCIHHR